MQNKDFCAMSSCNISDLSLVHSGGGKWIIISNGAGICNKKNEPRLVRFPIEFFNCCFKASQGILVEGMCGYLSFLYTG